MNEWCQKKIRSRPNPSKKNPRKQKREDRFKHPYNWRKEIKSSFKVSEKGIEVRKCRGSCRIHQNSQSQTLMIAQLKMAPTYMQREWERGRNIRCYRQEAEKKEISGLADWRQMKSWFGRSSLSENDWQPPSSVSLVLLLLLFFSFSSFWWVMKLRKSPSPFRLITGGSVKEFVCGRGRTEIMLVNTFSFQRKIDIILVALIYLPFVGYVDLLDIVFTKYILTPYLQKYCFFYKNNFWVKLPYYKKRRRYLISNLKFIFYYEI